jgi:protein-tyrosine phosphatase
MTPPRELQREVLRPFEKVSNFRDIGGVETADGRTLKTGVLYRSDELSRMTPRDLAKLQEFNIKVVCDLRAPRESQKKQPRFDQSIRLVNIPLVEQATNDALFTRKAMFGFLFSKTGDDKYMKFTRELYHHFAFGATAQVREVITLLSKEENLPAVIHCGMGKDRTGFLAAMIQLLVGVPYKTVMDEYLRTNDHIVTRYERAVKVMRIMTLFQVSPERMRLMIRTQPDFLDDVHDAIVKRYGSIEAYLREACEITPDTQDALRNRLLA